MPTDPIRAALERLLNDLQCLILKSQGVSGLCRDGDLVTWPDLLKPGGCYSPWIGYAIAAARDALDAADAGGGEALLAAPAAEGDGQRSAVLEAVGKALGSAYDCLRVWEAWSVGTMGPDDFALVAEDDARLAEIADAVIQAMRPATPAAPPKGELVAWLNNHAAHLRTMEGIGALPETELQERLDRAATLLQQQAAELAALRTGVVSVAVSERPWEREGWCDEQGRCWFLSPRFLTWSLESPPVALCRRIGRLHSLPSHAIPLPAPQCGEVKA